MKKIVLAALYQSMAANRNWRHRKRLPLTNEQKYWLRGNQSLTKQLVDWSDNHFRVQVINESYAKPYAHEAKKLALPPSCICKIREVELICKDKAVVFARSVIPLQALKGNGLQLAHLGNKPLGHLLFKQARVDLNQREIANIEYSSESYWARRTLYKFHQANILVSEFFLDII